MIKQRVWTSWIQCNTPHFSRGGRFLSFGALFNWREEYAEHVEMDMLLSEARSALFEALTHLERGGSLTITIEVEQEEK